MPPGNNDYLRSPYVQTALRQGVPVGMLSYLKGNPGSLPSSSPAAAGYNPANLQSNQKYSSSKYVDALSSLSPIDRRRFLMLGLGWNRQQYDTFNSEHFNKPDGGQSVWSKIGGGLKTAGKFIFNSSNPNPGVHPSEIPGRVASAVAGGADVLAETAKLPARILGGDVPDTPISESLGVDPGRLNQDVYRRTRQVGEYVPVAGLGEWLDPQNASGFDVAMAALDVTPLGWLGRGSRLGVAAARGPAATLGRSADSLLNVSLRRTKLGERILGPVDPARLAHSNAPIDLKSGLDPRPDALDAAVMRPAPPTRPGQDFVGSSTDKYIKSLDDARSLGGAEVGDAAVLARQQQRTASGRGLRNIEPKLRPTEQTQKNLDEFHEGFTTIRDRVQSNQSIQTRGARLTRELAAESFGGAESIAGAKGLPAARRKAAGEAMGYVRETYLTDKMRKFALRASGRARIAFEKLDNAMDNAARNGARPRGAPEFVLEDLEQVHHALRGVMDNPELSKIMRLDYAGGGIPSRKLGQKMRGTVHAIETELPPLKPDATKKAIGQRKGVGDVQG